MEYKYKFQIITEEWIDIIYLYNNDKVIRKTNNDNGKYILKENNLEINWLKWGKEIFIKHNNLKNTFYNLKSTIFQIFLENNEWNDIGIFNLETNIISRKYFPSEKGQFKFNDDELIINWEHWGSEKFYPLNFGKIYSNTSFANKNKE
jgi:hypothetical protein